MSEVQPVDKRAYHGSASGGGLRETLRSTYNPSTQKFESIKSSDTKKIEHMENIEEQIAKLPVPTDFSSPTFLQTVRSKTQIKGERLSSETQGVAAFFSGKDPNYNKFISSITKAQAKLI